MTANKLYLLRVLEVKSSKPLQGEHFIYEITIKTADFRGKSTGVSTFSFRWTKLELRKGNILFHNVSYCANCYILKRFKCSISISGAFTTSHVRVHLGIFWHWEQHLECKHTCYFPLSAIWRTNHWFSSNTSS